MTPSVADAEAVLTLREILDRAPYTTEAIHAALGTQEDVISRVRDLPVHVRRLRTSGPFGALVRLFLLNVPTDADAVAEALAPLTLDAAARMAVLEVGDGTVTPLVRLVPHDDLVIASDPRPDPGQIAHERVPGVHRPSVTLAHLTVRTPVERGLDLGAGNGIEAILMARHAKHVVGSDVNPRAIEYARFNGLLNRQPDIDWRVGSWFEPMRGERFDVIACNPPYVISPATQLLYRDSGMEGDSVSEQVVREVAAHLAEGGYGTVTVSWSTAPDDADAGAVRRWVAGTGCDAWVLHYRTEDPLTTAKTWNEHEATDMETYARALDEWLAYYERLGIAAVAYGAVILRRRTGANWVKVDPLPAGRLRPASDHIRRVFAAQDDLAALDDAALLERRFRPSRADRITLVASAGGQATEPVLSLEEGLGFTAAIDEHIVDVLRRMDGRPLRSVLRESAAARGIAAADGDRFVTAGASLARRLYALGFLERHTDAAAAQSA